MKVWIVQIGEPLPWFDDNARAWRCSMISEYLSRNGIKVIYWTSTFSHGRKKYRFDEFTSRGVGKNITIKLLHSPFHYSKNVSLRRILYHSLIAREFWCRTREEERPDVIFCAMPNLELAEKAVEYGIKNSVPVIIDVRDLWPDIFLKVFPPCLRKIIYPFLFYQIKKARYIFKNTTCLSAVTGEFLSWALKYADRSGTAIDRVIPQAYERLEICGEIEKGAHRYWQEKGVNSESWNICFLGTLERQFEMNTVITAAKILKSKLPQVKFVLCGSGSRLSKYKKNALGLDNIVFPGWVNRDQIFYLMKISKLGLAPYVNTKDFMHNLPNKPIEYMSSGLPVITCLKGVLESVIKENLCGYLYRECDPEDLSRLVEKIYNDPDGLKEKSRNARELYERKFTAGKVYGEIDGYFREVIKAFKRK